MPMLTPRRMHVNNEVTELHKNIRIGGAHRTVRYIERHAGRVDPMPEGAEKGDLQNQGWGLRLIRSMVGLSLRKPGRWGALGLNLGSTKRLPLILDGTQS